MFIGIVFLATLIFEAVSGKKAHPAQYILVGLAQCVFYLLLLSLTELIGFTTAFAMRPQRRWRLLAYYAGASFKSQAVGVRALAALAVLYGAMYVLMTLEDFALLAGSLRRLRGDRRHHDRHAPINWYGARPARADGGDKAMRVVAIEHVQLAMPEGGEAQARRFYRSASV